MSEAEEWAIIVRATTQEIQKWQQQALDLSKPLRNENTRLARVNGVAVIALRYYGKTAISACAVDALEKIAALDGGKGVQGGK